jgi:hypothetical protein
LLKSGILQYQRSGALARARILDIHDSIEPGKGLDLAPARRRIGE